MNTLSRPVRRLLALVLLALPPALLWMFLAEPWMDEHARLSERMERALAVEMRALSLAGRELEFRQEGGALRQALSGVADLPASGSYALAGAELQRRLREAAGRARGSLSSIETMPEGRAGDGMVGVRARLQTDAEGLQRLLAELETGKALLQVHSLSLASVGISRSRLLDVQLDLRGPRREEAAR
ncbi:type II secretion system protein GspM [Roseomonas marmotae]|uniref:General secretion pathway protein GspM n=1 Tax=Roseomonas marmotae TaxID=2768161 RepID=A0ABS3KC15_9PROT|nr:type II secretion system protein GspM [Roseomonas marmotae]MBO1075010.1 hypothetical protein [Roseomonas marmotae]QTI79954.1 hypothetical protein IAI58_04000 [Roseomonas marmotae]